VSLWLSEESHWLIFCLHFFRLQRARALQCTLNTNDDKLCVRTNDWYCHTRTGYSSLRTSTGVMFCIQRFPGQEAINESRVGQDCYLTFASSPMARFTHAHVPLNFGLDYQGPRSYYQASIFRLFFVRHFVCLRYLPYRYTQYGSQRDTGHDGSLCDCKEGSKKA
jgi:hypothetical protein